MMVREAREADLQSLLELYTHLHETEIPPMTEHLRQVWKEILQDKNHHMIVYEKDGEVVSSCVCVIVPNLTRSVRPYALIENVVTHEKHRGNGYASACLAYASSIAQRENCYKMMLLTGSKEEKTLDFYRASGYNSTDKTAFIKWLD